MERKNLMCCVMEKVLFSQRFAFCPFYFSLSNGIHTQSEWMKETQREEGAPTRIVVERKTDFCFLPYASRIQYSNVAMGFCCACKEGRKDEVPENSFDIFSVWVYVCVCVCRDSDKASQVLYVLMSTQFEMRTSRINSSVIMKSIMESLTLTR